jgi:DNA polymerase-3 subunit delta
MKLTGRDAAAYLKAPDPAHAGLLIFGADAMRVATKRQEAIRALVGPSGEEEMRLTRLNAAEVRKDPALVQDGLKAQGFFPGHRIVFVEDATDTLTKTLEAALADWRPGDAQLVVTAGSLTTKATLRKIFEGHRAAVAIGIYDDPPDRAEVEAALQQAGITMAPRDVMDAVFALAQTLEPGDFRQTVEKLGLYKLGDTTPLIVEELSACAPQSADVDIDDVLDVISAGQPDRIGPVLSSLYGQGVTPVTLSIGAMRHFRRLHQVASDPGGAGAGIGRLRPPVFGPRRDKIMRQASHWGRDRLEKALSVLTDSDLSLRSAGQTAPQKAVMERTLLRLAMMGRR